MEKSKLIGLLKKFDGKELRAFKDFVESPYFNKNEDLIQLYRYLKKQASKNFPVPKIARKVVFNVLFPNQSYNEKQFNHLSSLLLKLAERFIGLRKIEQAGVTADCFTMQDYIDRRLEKQYQQVQRQALKKIEETERRDEVYFLQQFQLADIANKQFMSQNIRQMDNNIQKAADYFDLYFLGKKLKYLCEMLDRENFFQKPYQKTMVESIKTMLREKDYSHIPFIAIYHKLLLILTESQPEPHFLAYRRLLQIHAKHFSPSEIKTLYYYAINFCIQKIPYGDKKFAEELLWLFEEGIQGGFLLEDGQLSPWTYKNRIKLGLGLGRFDDVQNFVTEYSQKLPDKEREAAYHFNLADLFYHKKEYDKSQFHLNQVEFTDIHYNLGAKVMLLKIYYEKGETEAFLSLQSALRIYLQRNKLIAKKTKEAYSNFVTLLYKIYKYGAKQPKSIAEKIDQTKLLNGRRWLKDQLNLISR